MQLEDYFEFKTFDTPHGPVDRIRVKASRIDVEFLIRAFNEGYSPGRIRQQFPTLSLEQVYATITYYLANKPKLDDYILQGERIGDAYYQEWLKDPPPIVLRLRALKAQAQKGANAP
jgi:uncharacterized protein (DUF433 family)